MGRLLLWPLKVPALVSGNLYVSSSTGSDTNPGTISAPFKTLAKVAQLGMFAPGASILLKCGDTWTNETLNLYDRGAGWFASGAYDLAYNSTLASQISGYAAGTATPPAGAPTQAQMQTLLTVSETAGQATTDATEYARRLSVRDALIAARNTARSNSLWITIGSYGAGAAPILDGTGTTMIGIDLSGPNRTYQGGWKVDNIEVKNYKWCGIRATNATQGLGRGVWITSTVSVHNITGYVFNTTLPYTYGVVAGSYFFMPSALDVTGVNNADVSGTYNSNDMPVLASACSKSVIDGVSATNSNYESLYFDAAASTTLFQNCLLDGMCNGPGLPTGSTGIIYSNSTDVILYNNEIRNVPKRTQDGTAVDFEASVIKGLFLANNFHDNADAAIELLANPGSEQYTMIIGNTLTNNGIGYAANTHGGVVFVNYAPPDTLDHIILVNNTITKATSPVQSWLFSARNTTLTNTMTDIWSQNPIFGPDNTVI